MTPARDLFFNFLFSFFCRRSFYRFFSFLNCFGFFKHLGFSGFHCFLRLFGRCTNLLLYAQMFLDAGDRFTTVFPVLLITSSNFLVYFIGYSTLL